MEWFECKVQYDKTQENGLIKSTKEAYLVDGSYNPFLYFRF